VAAERAGFSTLGTIDRVVYGNLEPWRHGHTARQATPGITRPHFESAS
jgi:hypothetical protein